MDCQGSERITVAEEKGSGLLPVDDDSAHVTIRTYKSEWPLSFGSTS